ncbi:hypothetical protein SeLEV6574_g01035 [Synchytrium endobioticum]|uniref:Uncharacterized protein n=1 Tax=Synchytrium endobioticum TaxID=286115 RepID=A0A507DFM8_9FUNG|nr:hypothetical protein SeLEV6574_g01035 [Synchytrium endobioticum]
MARDLRTIPSEAAKRFDDLLVHTAYHPTASGPVKTLPSSLRSTGIAIFQGASDMNAPDPDPFYGDIAKYNGWRFKLFNVIRVRSLLNTDAKRIIYIYMKGTAESGFQMWSESRDMWDVRRLRRTGTCTDVTEDFVPGVE